MTEVILNREFEEFYCPITGKIVLHPDGYRTPSTLVFIYVEEIQDFEYVNNDIRTRFPQHFNELGETLKGKKLFKKLKKLPNWMEDKLLVTYGLGGSASLCFDMGYEVETQ